MDPRTKEKHKALTTSASGDKTNAGPPMPRIRPRDSQHRHPPNTPIPIGEYIDSTRAEPLVAHEDHDEPAAYEENPGPKMSRQEYEQQLDRRLRAEQDRAYNWAIWRTTCFFQILDRAKGLNIALRGTSKCFPVDQFRRSTLPGCCTPGMLQLWAYVGDCYKRVFFMHGRKTAMGMSAEFVIMHGPDTPNMRLFFTGRDEKGNKYILLDGIESEGLITRICTPHQLPPSWNARPPAHTKPRGHPRTNNTAVHQYTSAGNLSNAQQASGSRQRSSEESAQHSPAITKDGKRDDVPKILRKEYHEPVVGFATDSKRKFTLDESMESTQTQKKARAGNIHCLTGPSDKAGYPDIPDR